MNEWLSGDFLNQLRSKLLVNEAVAEWFNVEALSLLFDAQTNGHNRAREIWGVMQFAIWHRLFMEGSAHTPDFNEDPLEWIS